MNTTKRIAVFTGCVALSGAGGAVAAGALQSDPAKPIAATTTVIQPSAAASSPAASTSGLTAEEIYDRTTPSVAHITSRGVREESPSPFGGGQSGTATGTGFVVSASGLIATNAHVVDGAQSITVKVGDGSTKTATLVGKDDSTDVALLRIDPAGQTLKPLTLADSSTLDVGDGVVAIGDPYGLDSTLTTGVISALDRSIQSPNGFSIVGAIQTDAALNPGNSGGPLLNSSGDVVGINSQIESTSGGDSGQGQNSGIGFAVPSNMVKKVLSELASGQSVRHAYLGVSTQDRTSGAGATVAQVVSGGPADRAGLRQGDAIVKLDSTTIADANELTAAVDARDPNNAVTLTVVRDGGQRDVHVTLGTRPSQAPGAGATP